MNDEFVASQRQISCADGTSGCVDISATYNACGADISSFIVDDEQNIYFWSEPWVLQSLDSEGNFRWLYRFCEPSIDPICVVNHGNCPDDVFAIQHLVADFDGVLYFFMGSTLFALSADGELLLQKEIDLAVHDSDSSAEFFVIGNGRRVSQEAEVHVVESTGHPVMTPEGEIVAPFVGWRQTEEEGTSGAFEKQLFGLVRLSRAGEVLDVFEPPLEPGESPLDELHVTQTQDRRFVLTGRRVDTPSSEGDIYDSFSFFFESSGQLQASIPLSSGLIHTSWARDNSDFADWPLSGLAVDETGGVLGLGIMGTVLDFDLDAESATTLLALPPVMTGGRRSFFGTRSSPVVDSSGTTYVVADERSPTYQTRLIGLDLDVLRDEPFYPFLGDYPQTSYDELPGVEFHVEQPAPKGGYSTPVLGATGSIYTGLNGLNKFDAEGTHKWTFGSGQTSSTVVLQDDGSVIVGQVGTGRVYFLEQSSEESDAMLTEAWPKAFHDRYQSNSAAHPFAWPKDGTRPYPSLDELMTPDNGNDDVGPDQQDASTGPTTPDADSGAQDDSAQSNSKSSGCAQVGARPIANPVLWLGLPLLMALRSTRRWMR